MYCTKCGTTNDANATTCAQCGNALHPPAYGTPATPPTPPPPPAQSFPPPPQPPQQYQQAPIAQAYTQPPATAAQVPNYLVQAILVTLFCCLPFGIASIIYASQVNTKLAIGDIPGAMAASKQAKLFAWIGFGASAVVIGCYLLFLLLVMMGAIASGTHVH